ncbi:MAG: efflux RND transporter periplasmic adaptor subunit [Phycisphaerales bacterium]|jgi:RND family efflux transporter MFP subunit
MRAGVKSWVARSVVVSGAMACLAMLGCERQQAAFVPPPPPEVTVESPTRQRVADAMEFTGTTRGYETVEIRARVRGFLEKKHVQDGKRVQQGDLLFTIDPRTFEAAVEQARAELATRESELKLAIVTLERTSAAAATNAVSKQEVDRAAAQRDGAIAQVDLAKARLRAAELDLEFTNVRSPITGRIGFIRVEEGELVGASEPTLLATVINDSKVYATYDMDERVILELRRGNQNKRPGEDGRAELVVRMAMANEEGWPHVGRFERADNTVNSATGTLRVESIFENPDGAIVPGTFVRVRPEFGEKDVLTVPDVAVMADQRGRYVLVVAGAGAEGSVERRDVTVGEVVERRRVIMSGLTEADRVITNGVQRARPGGTVKVGGGK